MKLQARSHGAVGNRTAMTDTTGAHTYTYDAANRLTSVDGVPYTWDDRGNLLSDGTFTYAYNSAGRMVRAESVTSTLVYTYTSASLSAGTASGLRVAQSVDGDVTEFAWDWASGLPEMLSESPSSHSPFLYLVGHDTLGRWDGATWAYHLPDALGSVRQVADATGAVTSSREWTPYGVEVGAGQAGLGYTGEYWDGAVGLQYLRARWLAPSVGRFTQQDPIAGILGQRRSYNAYGYAEQNPINRVDPSGLLSNNTIMRSFGVGRFEDVLAIIELSGDWGYLKMLQDAEVGDKVYAGHFNWTEYLGTIECYDPGRHSPEPWYWPGPWQGGVVFVSSSGEEHLVEQSKRTEFYAHSTPSYPPYWYYLNHNYVFPAYTTRTDLGVLPDYVVASGGGPLAKLVGLVGLGWNINVAVDRYGNIYGGGAFDVSAGPLLAGGLALGWLNQNGLTGNSWIPNSAELQSFIEGWGGGVAGYAVMGGGIAYNYDFPRGLFSEAIAGEVGIAIPTVGWSFLEGMFWVTQVSWLEWDWVDRYPIQHGYGRQDIRMVDDRPVDCGC